LPWPVTGEYVGAAAGMIFVVARSDRGLRYLALRPEARGVPFPQLGGTDPLAWPDGCTLLTPSRLEKIEPGYTAYPVENSRWVAGVPLPRPTRCRYIPRSGDPSEAFEIHVTWTAPTPAAAATLAGSVLPLDARATPLARNAYLMPDPQYETAPALTNALLVSGRSVIRVLAPGNAGLARRVALALLPPDAAPPPDPHAGYSAGRVNKVADDLGYRITDHDDDFLRPGPLRGFAATPTGSASGQPSEVFFFHGGELAGVAHQPSDEAASPTVAHVNGKIVRVTWSRPAGLDQYYLWQNGTLMWRPADRPHWTPAPKRPPQCVFEKKCAGSRNP
jgi:hypothetical protein